ncbi:hypothetical protein [Nostocoides sp. F2B08]|uniref:hypothetical protein n=1 Tax=Nostocoides sp. F2B08 TaxID=2653936 RepID=UPI00186AE79B|nr:hypothetical protein [Tetrasphaera sp. F2B08]
MTNAVREEVVEVYDSSGALVGTQVYRDAHDPRGRLLTASSESFDAEGTQTRLFAVTNTYESGRLVTETRVDDLDGAGPSLPITRTLRTTYDKRGLVSGTVTEVDHDGDGVADETATATLSTDVKSRTITTSTEADLDNDGVAEISSGSVRVYDQHGNVISETVQTSDADGQTSITTYTGTYGPQSRQLTTSLSFTVDGLEQIRSNSSFTYDKRGDLLQIVTITEAPGADPLTITDSYTYDARGRLLTSTQIQAGVVFSSTSTLSRTYDARGRLVEVIQEGDSDTDGVIDARTTQTLTYDGKSRVVQEIHNSYIGTDTLQSSTTITYAYTKDTTVLTYETDNNADGVIDEVVVVSRIGF